MYFLITLIAVTIISILLSRGKLNKTAGYFYAGALLVNLISTYLSFKIPEGEGSPVLQIFIRVMRQGHVGISFLVIVMMLGALKKNKVVVDLFKIRGELSILSVIFLFNHFVYYLVKIAMSLPKWHTMSKTALVFTSMVSLLSIWAWIICIPLFVTSFKSVRRKMNAGRWKAIQRYAYIMYALVYLHIMFAFLSKPNFYAYSFDIMIYSGVFWIYLCLRLQRYAEKLEKREEGGKAGRIIKGISLLCVAALLAIGYLLHAGNQKQVRMLEEEKRIRIQESEKRIRALEKEKRQEESKKEEMEEEAPIQENTFKDGTYTGQAEGYNGMITVEVTVQNDDIQKVELVSHSDDKAYISRAMTLLEAIEESDSTEVDTVSGATISSKGLIKATENALEKAVNNE